MSNEYPHPLKKGLMHHVRQAWYWIGCSAFMIGLLSLIWFVVRTGGKPSRAAYPCQQAAAAQSSLWLAAYIFPLTGVVKQRMRWKKSGLVLLAVIMAATIASGIHKWSASSESWAFQGQTVELDLQGRLAVANPAANLFVVQGTVGNDGGLTTLIDLMGIQGTAFYQSSISGKTQGPAGLISRDDTIIIKVNSQWDERGGTNTDLIKSLIQTITSHPDGFSGEIIVADNGQGQYGLNGAGGSLDYSRNNAEDTAQSVQKVVDSLSGPYRISTYLWDSITTKKVGEFSDGNLEDGYVLNTSIKPQTGIIISYPKFKTRFGTYISFKNGTWNPQTRSYNSDNLKIINVPVLKSHGIYGVTASIKHYMGVGSDKLTAQAGARMHNTVGSGGMGAEMVETRFPVLNILDAIWVNANPGSGPRTSYNTATKTGIIAASTDPAALDYWAAKNILVKTAEKIGKTNVKSLDPDNIEARSFGQWLRLSMQEINNAGYGSTVDEARMNVFVSKMYQETAISTPTPTPAIISPVVATPVVTVSQSPAPTPTPPASSSPDSAEGQASPGWWNIVIRVIVPILIAGIVIAILSNRMRKR